MTSALSPSPPSGGALGGKRGVPAHGTRFRVLALTKIFPNALEPLSAPFNRQQFAALSRLCDVEVMAAIPWFPGARAFSRWSAAGRLQQVPERDVIAGLPVSHPRFFFVPKLGWSLSGLFYAASLLPHVKARAKTCDVILGSWAYPDGVAAVALGRLLSVPVVVKLHGSDMNVIGQRMGPRLNLRTLLPHATRVVAVSRALAERAQELGVDPDRIDIVGNGVDSELFHPQDRAAARRELGLPESRPLILYVGRLEKTKGVLDLLDAFAALAARRGDLELALVGDGAARSACAEHVAQRTGRVRLCGARPLEEVPRWMAACDLLALPSWNEGTPNVILEAFACGRPVVATRTGGIPDLISTGELGELVPVRDGDALALALERVAYRPADAQAIVELGARGGWDESARALHAVLLRAAAKEA